jgi:pimeloyl-ACP methyl ester carboxylesterase
LANIKLFYRKRVSTGPWIVLLHGLQSCSEAFDFLFQSKELQSYSLLAVDLVGFGSSEKPQTFSYDIDGQAEQLLKLIDELGISEFSVVGHSLGGMIATLFLQRCQSRVKSIVSMEGNLTFADCGASAQIANLKKYVIRRVKLVKNVLIGSVNVPAMSFSVRLRP